MKLNLDELIEDFLMDLKLGGSSLNTVVAYASHLKNFSKWCEETKVDFLGLTQKHTRAFRNHLAKRNYNPGTINMHLYALKVFYDFLAEEDIVPGNPIITRRLHVNEPKRKPAFLTDEEIQAILDYFQTRKFKHENFDAIRIMLATGLRVSELVALTPQDVILQDNRVFVHVRNGKGNKERYVPVTDRDVALRLLELQEQRAGTPNLLKITVGGLKSACFKCSKRTGIHFHAHRLRHTLATRLLNQGYPIDWVQEVLGHENIATTRRYAATLPQSFFRLAAKVG